MPFVRLPFLLPFSITPFRFDLGKPGHLKRISFLIGVVNKTYVRSVIHNLAK
jgi:hypothetical protein